MNDVRAWIIDSGDWDPWPTLSPGEAKDAQEAGCTVTPLVAAPPEGAPTRQEITDLLVEAAAYLPGYAAECLNSGRQKGYAEMADLHARVSTILSRLPKDSPPTGEAGE